MFAEQCGSESDKHLLKLSRVRALSYWLCCSSFMLDSFTQSSLAPGQNVGISHLYVSFARAPYLTL